MVEYHSETYTSGDAASVVCIRRLKAEYHLIGSNLRQTQPFSLVFICSKCGKVYARRSVTPSPGWPEPCWVPRMGACSEHGGGSFLQTDNELFEHDRYPDATPYALLKHEFLILAKELLNNAHNR